MGTIMKLTNRLNPARAKAAGVGLHADGDGLYLQVTDGKSGRCRSWLFRYTLAGKQRYMGLGVAAVAGQQKGVSLEDARKVTEAARSLLRKGIDPIDARDEEAKCQRAEAEERARAAEAAVTFRQTFEEFFADKAKSLTNHKHIWQWRSTLEK